MTSPLAPARCTVPLVEVRLTEFDLTSLPQTGAVFDRLLSLHPAQVVADLSGCRHIDAAAIGLLLDLHRRLTRAGGVLMLRDPNPRIRRILATARLDQVLPLVGPDPATPATGTADSAATGEIPLGRPAPAASGRAPVPARN
ncbi:anti-sigma factor antagonist [Micromonospora sp. KC606]|uniref:STAS domain-containing protein n=1 Tax=Micromonospora sp. KC606 TaxID=2530379 RepID=UPI00104F436F|nr:STAS domain-containing protein [Micromonospora sp. KC606]TDC73038.1 anti-sigma factor antagonist [Micromonospora sp. KC606]